MDSMRFLRYSSCTRSSICPPVKASFVKIHKHAANLDPTQLSSSSHPRILYVKSWRRRRLLLIEHGIVCYKSFITAPFVNIIRRRRGYKVLFCHPPLQLSLYFPLLVTILQDSCHRCQQTQSRCVPSSKRSRNCIRNRLVDDFVVLFDFMFSRPKMIFNSVGAENHNRLHSTTHTWDIDFVVQF